MKNMKLSGLIRDYGIIVISAFIYAVSFNWFFDLNEISMGGFTGIAQIINHYLPQIPVGVMVVVLNIPLFILGVRFQGFHVLWSSIFAMVISSVFMDVIPLFITFRPMEDHLVACIFGGAMLGLSLGMMLWVGATTGGTELAASLLKRKFVHIQIGRICLIIDVVVIVLYALVFQDLDNALYAGIALFISSVAMDAVIYGRRSSKTAFIICSEGEKILKALLEEDMGVTRIEARGGYSNEKREVLICAFKPSRIARIRSIVAEIDPKAFVIICDAKDVFGEGFLRYDMNL